MGDGRKEAMEIIAAAKAAQSLAGEATHQRLEIDTIILPASKASRCKEVTEWLRFNGFEVVFSDVSPSSSFRTHRIGPVLISPTMPNDGYVAAFGSSRVWGRPRRHDD